MSVEDTFHAQPCAVCGLPLGSNSLVCPPARGWMHTRCYLDKVQIPPMSRDEVEELLR